MHFIYTEYTTEASAGSMCNISWPYNHIDPDEYKACIVRMI